MERPVGGLSGALRGPRSMSRVLPRGGRQTGDALCPLAPNVCFARIGLVLLQFQLRLGG